MQDQSNPLNDAHLEAANSVLESEEMALELGRKCAGCGLDMSEYEKTILQQSAFMRSVKAKFFPGQ